MYFSTLPEESVPVEAVEAVKREGKKKIPRVNILLT